MPDLQIGHIFCCLLKGSLKKILHSSLNCAGLELYLLDAIFAKNLDLRATGRLDF